MPGTCNGDAADNRPCSSRRSGTSWASPGAGSAAKSAPVMPGATGPATVEWTIRGTRVCRRASQAAHRSRSATVSSYRRSLLAPEVRSGSWGMPSGLCARPPPSGSGLVHPMYVSRQDVSENTSTALCLVPPWPDRNLSYRGRCGRGWFGRDHPSSGGAKPPPDTSPTTLRLPRPRLMAPQPWRRHDHPAQPRLQLLHAPARISSSGHCQVLHLPAVRRGIHPASSGPRRRDRPRTGRRGARSGRSCSGGSRR
jgi:hypothetical protein